jgi:hypothetical protein
MFWAFKLSFDADILAHFGHLFPKFGEILSNFLVTLAGENLKVVWAEFSTLS